MAQASHKRAVENPTIPDRLYFKIGDVAKLCGLETYVLRFWESQFPQLKPNKSGTGQRLYRRREVEIVLEIKRLVYGEGYTLSGARHALDQNLRKPAVKEPRAEAAKTQPAREGSFAPRVEDQRRDAIAATIGHARAELRDIVTLLSNPVANPAARSTPRRRPRLATLPYPTESLFPS